MWRRDSMTWMLADAVELLQSAGRLQRQFSQVGLTSAVPCWEPPVDIYESAGELGVLVALPGVAPDRLDVSMEDGAILVSGERPLGAGFGAGDILCLEIPYGRFERRIGLPHGSYRLAEMQLEHGCLRLQLERLT
jgi:HSP20 family protein